MLLCVVVISPYWSFDETESDFEASLLIFDFNESKHHDVVSDCWYDSGDYVIFAHRNALSVYYLALAYDHSHTDEARLAIERVLVPQIRCLQEMAQRNIKQIRDQDSHGVIVPPLLHEIMYPQMVYEFNPNEGSDVAMLMQLTSELLQDFEASRFWMVWGSGRTQATRSENCCEEGVVAFDSREYEALERIFDHDVTQTKSGWGISPRSLLLLQNKEVSAIKEILLTVKREWGISARQFWYLGGNYDIAGTIALERWYARVSGDTSFKSLSDSMYAYIHGTNDIHTNFTEYTSLHHPCGMWWSRCKLHNVLINGVDTSGTFDGTRSDIWRNTEMQLLGQAQYILAQVLYNEL